MRSRERAASSASRAATPPRRDPAGPSAGLSAPTPCAEPPASVLPRPRGPGRQGTVSALLVHDRPRGGGRPAWTRGGGSPQVRCRVELSAPICGAGAVWYVRGSGRSGGNAGRASDGAQGARSPVAGLSGAHETARGLDPPQLRTASLKVPGGELREVVPTQHGWPRVMKMCDTALHEEPVTFRKRRYRVRWCEMTSPRL